MRKPDCTAEIAALVVQVAGMPPEAGQRIEAALRRDFGGRDVRIERVPPITRELVNAELRQGKGVAVIAQELGVCRNTIYRRLRLKVPARAGSDTPAG